MAKSEDIRRYTAEELDVMPSLTNWAKVDATTPEEIERHAEEDGLPPEGWEKTIVIGLPPRKETFELSIDQDVLDWFKASGTGYQTRMNNILRAFMSKQQAVSGGD